MSSSKSDPAKENELKQDLIEIEQALVKLQERHAQIKQDVVKRSQLLTHQHELKQQQKDTSVHKPLKTELRQLQQELDILELSLESLLLPDLFWQVIRFVFLGIVIGWFLNIWVS
jgi:protein subunit release factor A